MPQEYSFDVVSRIDMQELRNAVDQAQREIGTRYDFKGSISEIELEDDGLKLMSDDEYKLKAVREVLLSKLIKRGVPPESLDYQKIEEASHKSVRQHAKFKQGVEADVARQIVKTIKDLGLKVQAQVQGDQVRVVGKNKDDLQKAINELKAKDFGIALQFLNYR